MLARKMKEESNVISGVSASGIDIHPPIMRFTADDAMTLYDEITADHCILMALGTFLASSDLAAFQGSDSSAEDRKCGIERILNSYIENQKAMLNSFRDKAFNSPEWLISHAEDTYNNVKAGVYGDAQLALNLIDKELSKLRAITSQFGPEEYPKAITLQNSLIETQKHYLSQKFPIKKAV